ncbi:MULTISPECIES: UDP-N-acetylglucosamine pyrophosphorylase [unclassified Ruminococcus]|uniref:UDP-N-acetylglucosamine pyrophosphorylase n=1 Tax=unclassified Ruminococcus TaxID=2608920 RepID=UPI00210AC30D|nr:MULTISPECIES: UDP-N-acetylglucosamine pyrophosphorylase [unclassified Ruminococcus]MCQ4022910.1 UDP-N-acetylglucosamine pyrophosphorylase [Ruminococcus sp. zg-924]MCQ4115274.1 UDP-N-acetylglucosamine pyrophosphorylase [Ruminococcus sp. zg-921]
MFEQVTTKALFSDLDKTIAKPLLENTTYPWEALDGLKDFILELGKTLPQDKYDKIGDDIWVAKSATVAPSASITGPLIVCEDAEIRHCAFIRGVAIVGRGAVVGNSTELKGTLLFDGVQVPHYNYVGDSILGYKSHMGAGSITSNLKSDKTIVHLGIGGEKLCTNRKKLGAILGDNVEVGCNSVLNPGTVIGRNTTIYPVSMVRGYVPENSIYKFKDEVVNKIESKEL